MRSLLDFDLNELLGFVPIYRSGARLRQLGSQAASPCSQVYLPITAKRDRVYFIPMYQSAANKFFKEVAL